MIRCFSTNKYSAKKTEVDGITFASKREAERYGALKMLRLGGFITALEIQPEFRLEINGKLICIYRADFRYTDLGKPGRSVVKQVVEEVKGFMTRDARIKIKLFQALYPDVELRVIK